MVRFDVSKWRGLLCDDDHTSSPPIQEPIDARNAGATLGVGFDGASVAFTTNAGLCLYGQALGTFSLVLICMQTLAKKDDRLYTCEARFAPGD